MKRPYNFIIYTKGEKIGNATFVSEFECGDRQNRKAVFSCTYCGAEFIAYINNIKKLHTLSCGCKASRKTAAERGFKHGCTSDLGNTTEYNTWAAMKSRCYNKGKRDYKNYGGRGIIVCERWVNNFENFLKDMGTKPSKKHSIDRVDNNGNYEPSNCRWATSIQQGQNKRNVIKVRFAGTEHLLKSICQQLGISFRCVYSKKHRRGLTYQDAFDSYANKNKLQ